MATRIFLGEGRTKHIPQRKARTVRDISSRIANEHNGFRMDTHTEDTDCHHGKSFCIHACMSCNLGRTLFGMGHA